MNNKAALVLLAVTSLGFAACPKETVGGKIDDAMNNRPAEKLQDGAENVKDAIKDATN